MTETTKKRYQKPIFTTNDLELGVFGDYGEDDDGDNKVTLSVHICEE